MKWRVRVTSELKTAKWHQLVLGGGGEPRSGGLRVSLN